MLHNGIIVRRMPHHNLMRKARQDGRVIAATEYLHRSTFLHLSTFPHLTYPAVAEEAVEVVVVVVVAAAVVAVVAVDTVNIYRRHYRLDL